MFPKKSILIGIRANVGQAVGILYEKEISACITAPYERPWRTGRITCKRGEVISRRRGAATPKAKEVRPKRSAPSKVSEN